MIYKSHDVSPSSSSITLNCPSDFGDLEYEVKLPIIFFIVGGEGGELILKHEPNAILSKKISHPIPDWDTSLEADWQFKIVFDEFDFDVDVDPAIETIEQGSKASPTVVVKKIRGQGNVDLTVTKWDGINAYLTNPSVTPTETTTLNIETTCDTKVGNYLFTVQGETKDSFKTSVDSVSIQVTKNPSC